MSVTQPGSTPKRVASWFVGPGGDWQTAPRNWAMTLLRPISSIPAVTVSR